MKSNKYLLLYILSFALLISLSCCTGTRHLTQPEYAVHPKREFRGAWMSTAWQMRYRSMNAQQMKTFFVQSLDQLKADGINAIIFQVRPQADAFYKSKYEPWSAHLTGRQGVAPDGGFDPLAFLTHECHKRGMELHAWLNPYRVTTSVGEKLADNHLYFSNPDLFVEYGGKIYFDPAIPRNREHIGKVVKDILLNYEVDAIHIDDYFYPYPIAGQEFDDSPSFAKYASQQGFAKNQLSDWRRNNVNVLIQELRQTIHQIKPWVRFGISPFGIYRNIKNTSDGSGSNTSGLEAYDALYADVKLWAQKGWIDYTIPQIYWEIGHTAADYTTLIKWWNDNNFKQPLYIGQDVKRTMDAKNASGENQLEEKMRLSRSLKNVSGNCFWPAYELIDNYGDVENRLRQNYHRYPALIPAYTHLHNKKPKKVGNMKTEYTSQAHILNWTSNHEKNNPVTAQYYVVYRFAKGEKENLESAQHIVAITNHTSYVLPYESKKNEYRYVVTAVDAFHNESKAASKKIKL